MAPGLPVHTAIDLRQGIVQLLPLGGLGIWVLTDLIRTITGSLQPKDGEYAKTL